MRGQRELAGFWGQHTTSSPPRPPITESQTHGVPHFRRPAHAPRRRTPTDAPLTHPSDRVWPRPASNLGVVYTARSPTRRRLPTSPPHTAPHFVRHAHAPWLRRALAASLTHPSVRVGGTQFVRKNFSRHRPPSCTPRARQPGARRLAPTPTLPLISCATHTRSAAGSRTRPS